MRLIDYLLSLVAPNSCFVCKKEGLVCCEKCLDSTLLPKLNRACYFCSKQLKLRKANICDSCFNKQSLSSAQWATDFEDPLSSYLIKSLKFNNLYESAKPIGKALSHTFSKTIKLNQTKSERIIVTAIPTANRRVRQRGWDQAKLIAKAFAKDQNLIYKSLLVRSSSFDQIGATKNQRREASKKFFKPTRLSLIKGSTIILVDDVLTTGSTLNAAAKILKAAGAKEVHGLAFARQGLKSKSNKAQ